MTLTEAKPKWLWLVGIDRCASLLVVAEGRGGSCREREGGGLLSKVGRGDGGCCIEVEGNGLVSDAREEEEMSSA